MTDLVPHNKVDEDFLRDLKSGWQHIPVTTSPWSTTHSHLNELYDVFNVDEVKLVLCLRLFASSLYEIANSPPESSKLMKEIFGDRLIGQVRRHHDSVYKMIEAACVDLSNAIRKSGILQLRATHPNHGWASVRHIYVEILKTRGGDASIIAGVAATILKDVVRADTKTWREDSPILPRKRFDDVFRVAFHVFDDEVGQQLRLRKAEILYESLASRLVSFYVRLAADTWRILVTRNGPREAPLRIRYCDPIPQPFYHFKNAIPLCQFLLQKPLPTGNALPTRNFL